MMTKSTKSVCTVDWQRFAADLRAVMVDQGANASQISRDTGVTSDILSRFFTGQRFLGVDSWVSLAAWAGLTLTDYVIAP
jgi:hypothetical protein